MAQQRHICFYSNKDSWSKAFIEELSKTPWVREFQFFCVDPNTQGIRPQLPKQVTQVPMLRIAGENEYRKDQDVMNWLYERKMASGQAQQQGQGQGVKGGSGGQSQGPMEPSSWNPGEMGGFGDAGYAFLDSAHLGTQANGGDSIPGNFSFLNGGASPGDRQSQMAGSSSSQTQGRTKKEQQFDAQMEMYMRQRDSGMPKQQRPAL